VWVRWRVYGHGSQVNRWHLTGNMPDRTLCGRRVYEYDTKEWIDKPEQGGQCRQCVIVRDYQRGVSGGATKSEG
jgi:hypothetical protein